MDAKETTTESPIERRVEAEPYSTEWWQERTTVELREIIKRGFGIGEAFDGAVVETERRAREAMRRVRDQAGAEVHRMEKNRLLALGGTLAALLLIALIAWLVG